MLQMLDHGVAEKGLCRADSFAARAQYSAQSTQAYIVLTYSFLPFATRVAQWWKHESHETWQSAHALAHLAKCSWCSAGCWASP